LPVSVDLQIMTDEVKILIADDHPVFRQGLRQVIERDPQLRVVAEAEDGAKALQQLTKCEVDVAVLDVQMPDKNGFEVAREIKERGLAVRLIFLTMYKDERFLNTALDIGAQGYLLKDSAVAEIIAAIKAVAAGDDYVSPALSTFLIKRSRRASLIREQTPGIETLTVTERRVLRLLADYKTNREIAEAMFISIRTVERHRLNIADKLGLHGSHALVKFATANKELL